MHNRQLYTKHIEHYGHILLLFARKKCTVINIIRMDFFFRHLKRTRSRIHCDVSVSLRQNTFVNSFQLSSTHPNCLPSCLSSYHFFFFLKVFIWLPLVLWHSALFSHRQVTIWVIVKKNPHRARDERVRYKWAIDECRWICLAGKVLWLLSYLLLLSYLWLFANTRANNHKNSIEWYEIDRNTEVLGILSVSRQKDEIVICWPDKRSFVENLWTNQKMCEKGESERMT